LAADTTKIQRRKILSILLKTPHSTESTNDSSVHLKKIGFAKQAQQIEDKAITTTKKVKDSLEVGS